MLANDARLANYLSRNVQITHYAEGDGERVLMQLWQFISHRNSGNEEAVEGYLGELAAKKNPLGLLLQCDETQEFLLSLYDLSHHFHVSPCMTGSWMRTNLNDVYGGVSFS